MRNPFKRSGDGGHNPGGQSYRYSRPSSSNKLVIIAGVITFIVIIVVMFESVVVVEAGHRGVVLYVGAVENRVLGEGIHFIIPFAEQVVQLEVRTLKFQADASAASNDLQEVQTTIALNYHISPSQANTIYQQLGADYADRIIAPTIQESVKASVAKFNAEELFQKYLTEQNNLLAIKVVANQTVVQAQAAARANVAKANGESQAIRIITSQLKQSPQYLQWLSINRWNGQLPYALGGTGGVPFFQLPLARQAPAQNQTQTQTQNQTQFR
jgi:regulator of protease activity HflC (stomatin/prohibitin superfamily)